MADRRQRDKEQTVEDVLKAAVSLFSRKGLHGTSLRDIEKASGVSKGLILHHFETKENLYAAVQDHLIQQYTSWMSARREVSKDLKDMITTAIREAFAYLKNNQEFRRIVLWAYLEDQERITDLEKRFTLSLIDAMRAGQESGLVRQDINPVLFPFIVRGTLDYWLRKERLRGDIYAMTQEAPLISDEELIAALENLLLN